MAIDCGQGGAGYDDPETDTLDESPEANLLQSAPGKTGSDEKKRGGEAGLA